MDLITTPGAYAGISLADYHGTEICVGHSVSHSGIMRIIPPDGNPRKYWAGSTLNPDREPEKPSDPMRFGAHLHQALTHPTEFESRVRTWDRKPGGGAEKLAWESWQASGGLSLRTADYEKIQHMIDAIRRDPWARRCFMGDGFVEQTLAWQDQSTGLWCRSRPDWRPDPLTIVPDLKSARSAHPAQFMRHAINLGYHVQAAMMMDGCKHALGVRPEAMIYVAQETSAPFCVQAIKMPEDAIRLGRMVYKSGLLTIAQCLENGEWPSYEHRIAEPKVPEWVEGWYGAMTDLDLDPNDAAAD